MKDAIMKDGVRGVTELDPIVEVDLGETLKSRAAEGH